MPNPFPGVNPFIEATADLWVGFHNVLIGQMSILLNAELLSRGYGAVVDKQVQLVDSRHMGGWRIPDVSVIRQPGGRRPAAGGGNPAAAAVLDLKPAEVGNPSYEEVSLAFIQIRAMPGREVITGIELLSPANKGSDRGEYIRKRAQLIRAGVNLVEVDLLLGGRPPDVMRPLPDGDFHALVTRSAEPERCDAYGWSIRDRLPRLPVPLRPGEPEAVLDLAAAYRMTYDGGPYSLLLPYDHPLRGSLSPADAAWVAERLTPASRTG